MSEFDARSEKNLATLRPKAQAHFRLMLKAFKEYAEKNGLDVRIISGNRTWAEQDALYAQGRTKPGKRVTNARGGQSNHNYQIAVDIGLFKGSDFLEESPHYKKLGPIAEALGLEWGGRWKSFPDTPHYQIKTGHGVSQLRELVRTRGWDAIDALIPTLVESPAPPPPPVIAPASPVSDPVSVFLEDGDAGTPLKLLDLDAWFAGGKTWVAIRDWSDYFGGEVVESNGKYRLVLNDQATPIPTRLEGTRTVAPFSDINHVLNWNFSFDGVARPRRLIIYRDPIS